MKFEKTEVWGFEHSIRGMRNPLESWSKSDSFDCDDADANNALDGSFCRNCPIEEKCLHIKNHFIIGKNDLGLMQKLIRLGTPHRKFMRQIFVSVDITAPLYFWKEFDTYKVGTTANSTSTMHKLASTPITLDCFEMDDFTHISITGNTVPSIEEIWCDLVVNLEKLRQRYNETKDKRYWKELIRLLPESWLQTRTITMNYENILNIVEYRKNHKLSEWSESFMSWVKSLPYADDLLFL